MVEPLRSVATRMAPAGREARPADLAAARAGRVLHRPQAPVTLQQEGLVHLHNSGKPVQWPGAGHQEKMTLPMGRAACNGASFSRNLDGLLFGKGSAKGKPALLVVQTEQPGERQSVEGLLSRTLCSGSDAKHGLATG